MRVAKVVETASVEAVTAQDVKAFRDLHVKQGKAQTIASLALKTLRSLFNDARREGLIAKNPAGRSLVAIRDGRFFVLANHCRE